MSLVDNMENCIFCGAKKDWNSNFRITDNDDRLIFRCTVCRPCRKKYAIEQIFERYDQLVDAEISGMKEKQPRGK